MGLLHAVRGAIRPGLAAQRSPGRRADRNAADGEAGEAVSAAPHRDVQLVAAAELHGRRHIGRGRAPEYERRAPVDGPVEIVAAIAGTAIYAASNGGSAFALDAATGRELWRVPIRGTPSGPTVAGGLLLIGTNVGELDAIGGTLP